MVTPENLDHAPLRDPQNRSSMVRRAVEVKKLPAELVLMAVIVVAVWLLLAGRHRNECDGTHQVRYERCM